MLPYSDGVGTLYRVDGAPNKLAVVLPDARMSLQPLKDGSIIIPPGKVEGIEVNMNALAKVWVGGYDENPTPAGWDVQVGYRLSFTGDDEPSMRTGNYIVVIDSLPWEGAGLNHRAFVVMLTGRG
jgi:hypothetical protein